MSVRPAITRSGRSAKWPRSMRKYSCSGPSVVKTRCTPLSPRSSRSSIALFGERVRAAEQRRHLVERLAVVADEHRRDAQRARAARLDDEHRARRVPRRVAARLPGGAQAARREARRIGLALDELRPGELLERLAVVVEVEEGVVLLGGEAGLRLEPVREVRHAAADRPFLDDLRDGRRDLEIELLSVTDGRDELGVHVLRQLVAHLARAEGVDPEIGRGRLMPRAFAVVAGRLGDARDHVTQRGLTRWVSGGGHGSRLGNGRRECTNCTK